MICIICKKEKCESKEHIIPEALGNKTFITYRVCKACNNKLGSNVDSYLTNHEIMKMLRVDNGLTEKDGTPISILNGMEIDTNTGIKYLVKNNKIQIVPRLIFPQNKFESVKVEASNQEDGLRFLKKLLKRKGVSDEDVEDLCKDYYVEFGEKLSPEFAKECLINYSLFDLAALKIVYEYSHFVLGDDYLNDELALLYSRELFNSTLLNKNDVKPSEELAPYIIFPVDDDLYNLIVSSVDIDNSYEDSFHFLIFFQSGNSLFCVLSLFFSRLFTFVIKVTNNCLNYEYDINFTFVKKDGTIISL